MAIVPKEFDQLELTSGQYTAVLTDEEGVAIDGTILTTMVLTLYNLDSDLTIINSRNDQDVLNTNGVTIDASGNLTWTISPADNAIVNSAAAAERHVALFEYTWSLGAKAGKHEVILVVKNLAQVGS